MKHNKALIGQIALLFVVNIAVILFLGSLASSQATVFKQGSSGEQVKTIQTKLKRWGFYTGEADGVYGSKTVEAVKYFQRTNGLTADGVCGQKTLNALGISTADTGGGSGGVSGGASGGTGGNRENELYLLSRMISAEARGEPYLGQVAVGAVILNRVAHPSFPNSLSGVLYQPGAFSPVADGNFDTVSITDSARKAAQDCINGSDPTGGAIYFYNPAKSTSKWIFSRQVVLTIGKHVFAK